MKNKGGNFKTIIINVISSMIFQIILIFISGSGIVITLRKVIESLKDNRVTISIFNLIILILSCIVITVSIVILCRTIFNHVNKNKKYDLSNVKDYYFSEYEKNITIYQNGNGIIIHKFKVVANDVSKLKKIRRKLNIEDGVKTSKFPSLTSMMQTKKSERFEKFGFWYISDDNIISDVKEFYWDSKMPSENKKSKNNPQEIRWIFKIDKNKLQKGIPYEIRNIISVPGLAPLQDGKLDKNLMNDMSEDISSSNMHIGHRIQKLIYTISFEDGISIDTLPVCKCVVRGQDDLNELDISGTEEYDILYRRYTFVIDNPIFGSDIRVLWKYNTI